MTLEMLKWGFFLLSAGGTFYLAWRKPEVLLAVLAGAVALEISITWFPTLGPLTSQLGSLARLLTAGIIGAALWQLWLRQEKRRELKGIWKHYLTWALLIYIGVAAFSMLYTVERSITGLEIFRLFTLFALYLSARLLMAEKTVLWPLLAVHWVGVALVPLAIYEGVTRNFIWKESLAVGALARVNATFVDPNIFARYLVLGIAANLVLLYLSAKTRNRFIYLAALCALLGGLAITLSRSGLLTLAVVLFLTLCLIPRKRMVWPIGTLGVAGSLILALRPTIWQRLLTFREGFGALDAQRQYLWKAAAAMFQDYPLGGVGLGGFQTMFLTKYISLKTEIPDAEGATLSHTTILTIAAELGIMGLAALLWFWLMLTRVLWSLCRLSKDQLGPTGRGSAEGETEAGAKVAEAARATDECGLTLRERQGYVPGVGYYLWIVTVFVSSQAEGRFFEDPIIWLSMAVLVYLLDRAGSAKKDEYTIAGH